jgi:hypothetical protein
MIVFNNIMVGLKMGLCKCLGMFVRGMDGFKYVGVENVEHKKNVEEFINVKDFKTKIN